MAPEHAQELLMCIMSKDRVSQVQDEAQQGSWGLGNGIYVTFPSHHSLSRAVHHTRTVEICECIKLHYIKLHYFGHL
jgi:hypothetical protein